MPNIEGDDRRRRLGSMDLLERKLVKVRAQSVGGGGGGQETSEQKIERLRGESFGSLQRAIDRERDPAVLEELKNIKQERVYTLDDVMGGRLGTLVGEELRQTLTYCFTDFFREPIENRRDAYHPDPGVIGDNPLLEGLYGQLIRDEHQAALLKIYKAINNKIISSIATPLETDELVEQWEKLNRGLVDSEMNITNPVGLLRLLPTEDQIEQLKMGNFLPKDTITNLEKALEKDKRERVGQGRGRGAVPGESEEDAEGRYWQGQLEAQGRSARKQFEIMERTGRGGFKDIPELGSTMFEGLTEEQAKSLRARIMVSNARARIQEQDSTSAVEQIPELRAMTTDELNDLTLHTAGVSEAWFIYTALTSRPDVMWKYLQEAGLEDALVSEGLGLKDMVYLDSASPEAIERARLVFAGWLGGKFGLPKTEKILEVGNEKQKKLMGKRNTVITQRLKEVEAAAYNLMRAGRVPESVDNYFNKIYGNESTFFTADRGFSADNGYKIDENTGTYAHGSTSVGVISSYGIRLLMNPGAEVFNSSELTKQRSMWPRTNFMGAQMYNQVVKEGRLKLWQDSIMLENAYARIKFRFDDAADEKDNRLLKIDKYGNVQDDSRMIKDAIDMLQNTDKEKRFDWLAYDGKGSKPFFRYEFYGVKRADALLGLFESSVLPKSESGDSLDPEQEVLAAIDFLNNEGPFNEPQPIIETITIQTIIMLLLKAEKVARLYVGGDGKLHTSLADLGAVSRAMKDIKQKGENYTFMKHV